MDILVIIKHYIWVLVIVIHLIIITTPYSRCYYYIYFTDEEASFFKILEGCRAEKNKNFLQRSKTAYLLTFFHNYTLQNRTIFRLLGCNAALHPLLI